MTSIDISVAAIAMATNATNLYQTMNGIMVRVEAERARECAWYWAVARHKRTLGRPARKRLLKAGYGLTQGKPGSGAYMTPLTYAIAIHPELVKPGSLLASVLHRRADKVPPHTCYHDTDNPLCSVCGAPPPQHTMAMKRTP